MKEKLQEKKKNSMEEIISFNMKENNQPTNQQLLEQSVLSV